MGALVLAACSLAAQAQGSWPERPLIHYLP
jgi:hypothetical protein